MLAAVGLAVALAAGGAAIGPIPAAAGAALGGFTTLLVDRITRRQAQRAGLAAVRDLAGSSGAAAALDAHLGIVPFTGREDELAELMAWCAGGAETGRFRLLTGAGGVGKTRLALHLGARMRASGWQCVEVGPDSAQAGAAVDAARTVYPHAPLLLIVDHAETRPGLGELVTAAFRDRGTVRVLLAARGQGDWWDQLCSGRPAVRQELVGHAPLQLEAPVAAGEPDQEMARAALQAFAAHYGVPPPPVRFRLSGAGRLPVIVLHAAALVAVLDTARASSRTRTSAVETGGVLDALLLREAVYWTPEPPIAELGPAARAHAVALLSLTGADDEAQAAEFLERVPELRGLAAGRLQVIAHWLHGRYPGATAEAMGTLQPDLVAERHVVNQIRETPRLAADFLTGLAPRPAARALTVLTRACAHSPEAAGILAVALRADLDHLAQPAIAVAVQTSGPLGQILDEVIGAADLRLAQLEDIAQAIPFQTVALAGLAVTVDQRILDELPAGAPPAERAKRASQLAIRLSQSGRYREALSRAEAALAIFRDPAGTDPDEIRPVLAAALANQATLLADLGQQDAALDAAGQAVQAYRDLAATDPSSRRYLITALYDQSSRLAESGRPADALKAADEAVSLCRNPPPDPPGDLDQQLASALNNRSSDLAALNRRAEALAAAEEAEQLFRKLTSTQPDAFRPGLASALTNKASQLDQLRRAPAAVAAAEEAAGLYRQLAGTRPEAYLLRLADVLMVECASLLELDRPDDAVAAADEGGKAVSAYLALPQARPERAMRTQARVVRVHAVLALASLESREDGGGADSGQA